MFILTKTKRRSYTLMSTNIKPRRRKKKKRIIEAYSFSSPHAAINVHIVHNGKAMFIIVIIVYIIIMRVLE